MGGQTWPDGIKLVLEQRVGQPNGVEMALDRRFGWPHGVKFAWNGVLGAMASIWYWPGRHGVNLALELPVQGACKFRELRSI